MSIHNTSEALSALRAERDALQARVGELERENAYLRLSLKFFRDNAGLLSSDREQAP